MNKKLMLKGLLGTFSIAAVGSSLGVVINNQSNLEYKREEVNSLTKSSSYFWIDMNENESYSGSSYYVSDTINYNLSISFADGTKFEFLTTMKFTYNRLVIKTSYNGLTVTSNDYIKYLNENIMEIIEKLENKINESLSNAGWGISVLIKSVNFKNVMSTTSSEKDIPIEYNVVQYDATTLTVTSVFLGIFCATTFFLILGIIISKRNKAKIEKAKNNAQVSSISKIEENTNAVNENSTSNNETPVSEK